MKRGDKFGRPIYSNEVWRRMLHQGRILTKLGYSESNRKPNLFYRTVDNETIFFADMRGTEIVPIWGDASPLFYTRFGSKVPQWKRNRMRKEEWDKLIKAKVYPRRAFEDHESWGENGYCQVCGKDFQANGYYCSQACAERKKRKTIAHELAELPRCEICGALIEDGGASLFFTLEGFPEVAKSIKKGYEHHVTYGDDNTIRVCSGCHAKIHRSEAYPALKPKEKRPKPKPKFELVRCESCGGRARIEIGITPFDVDVLCYKCRRREERRADSANRPRTFGSTPSLVDDLGHRYPERYAVGQYGPSPLYGSYKPRLKLRGKWEKDRAVS